MGFSSSGAHSCEMKLKYNCETVSASFHAHLRNYRGVGKSADETVVLVNQRGELI